MSIAEYPARHCNVSDRKKTQIVHSLNGILYFKKIEKSELLIYISFTCVIVHSTNYLAMNGVNHAPGFLSPFIMCTIDAK